MGAPLYLVDTPWSGISTPFPMTRSSYRKTIQSVKSSRSLDKRTDVGPQDREFSESVSNVLGLTSASNAIRRCVLQTSTTCIVNAHSQQGMLQQSRGASSQPSPELEGQATIPSRRNNVLIDARGHSLLGDPPPPPLAEGMENHPGGIKASRR